MSLIKFGIIGYGKMGQIRHQTLEALDGCEVVAIYDADPNLVPKDLGVKDPGVIINNSHIDAVILATPNYLMKDFIIDSLNHHKHVFAEKPPGMNLEETREISAVCSKTQNKLMFGFNHRHHESVIKAKKLIDSGDYGEILWMRGRYGKSVSPDFSDNWRSRKKEAGGGIFLDQGIHMLDLFMMMVGPFSECKSFVSNLYWKGDVEDNVFALFRNEKGQVASLHSTMSQWRHLFSWEIFLEKGSIMINGLKTSSQTYGQETLTYTKDRTPAPSASWDNEITEVFDVDFSWQRELGAFAEAIHKNKNIVTCGIDEAEQLMQMVDLVYKESSLRVG